MTDPTDRARPRGIFHRVFRTNMRWPGEAPTATGTRQDAHLLHRRQRQGRQARRPYLAAQGHQVTNADLVPLKHPDVADLRVDLTDAGETYSALAGLATMDELDLPEKPSYDAVVHFAAVPAILLRSDAATYATNVLSTYNVLEAATRLGVRKVIFASSETTYGVCFAQGERRPLYVPVDEEHPTVPEDSYAMSKVAGEVTARSFHARTGADIYGLRINNVIEPHEYAEMFPPFLEDPALRRRNIFAYIDTRDLGQMVQRCLETDGLGYEVFNVANADMSVAATTQEIRDRFYDGVEVRGRWAATRRSTPSTRRARCSATSPSTPGATCWPTRPHRRSWTRATSESLTAWVTAASTCWLRSPWSSRFASRARRSRSVIARVRTSSVFSAASTTESGIARMRGLDEAVEVGVVEGVVDQVRGRRQRAVVLHPLHRVEQTRAQGVDLGVRGVVGLRQLQREGLAS